MATIHVICLIRRVCEMVFPVAARPKLESGGSGDSDENARSRLTEQLPISFPVCGCPVTLRVDSTGKIEVEVGNFEGLKPHVVDLTGNPIKATASEIKSFILFLLDQPIGARWLCFGKEYFVNGRRCETLALALDAWRSLNGPRSKSGRLVNSMRCCAYVRDEMFPSVCANATKDPSGLCHHHRKAGALTIWNHNPFLLQDEMHRRVDRIVDG